MKSMVVSFLLASVYLLVATESVYSEPVQEITVSAAMSLKKVFETAGKAFEAKNEGMKAVFNFGASGDLARQIEGGAPVDLFASAAANDMDRLEKQGFVLVPSKKVLAKNVLVLIVQANAGTSIATFRDLTMDNVKRIVICDPKTSPAGRYSVEVFQYYEISDAIVERLVYAENVRQALDYVARGEVDAGIVYRTDALVRKQEVKIVAAAPETSHSPVLYPIAVVKGTQHEKVARAFISLMMSDEGKKILSTYGFKPIEPAK
jgi:molybdate transport system substrate-binding protein